MIKWLWCISVIYHHAWLLDRMSCVKTNLKSQRIAAEIWLLKQRNGDRYFKSVMTMRSWDENPQLWKDEWLKSKNICIKAGAIKLQTALVAYLDIHKDAQMIKNVCRRNITAYSLLFGLIWWEPNKGHHNSEVRWGDHAASIRLMNWPKTTIKTITEKRHWPVKQADPRVRKPMK